MSKILNIVIAGVGGQGSVVVSRILGECARIAGLSVLVGEVFGASQRLGSVHSVVRIAEQEIYSPQVCEGSADLIIALEPLEALRIFREFGSKNTKVLANTHRIMPLGVMQEKVSDVSLVEILNELTDGAEIVECFDATKITIENFKESRHMNVLLLSKACALGWLPFEFDVLETALYPVFSGKILEENLKPLKHFSHDKSSKLKEISSYYKLFSGNEAAAHGALTEGIEFAYSYPGSPVSEITEILIEHAVELAKNKAEDGHFSGLHAGWSVNETVALQKAASAALSGAKALAVMKQNGLNVAADFLLTFAHNGLKKGALVLVVGDDPGALASTSAIDSRWIIRAANVPVLTPSNPVETEMMLRWAFNLSEILQQLVIVRLTTRVAYQRSLVQVEHDANDMHWSAHWDKIVKDSEQTGKSQLPESWDFENARAVNLPVLPQKREQLAKLNVARNLSEKNMFNRVFGLKKSEKFDMLDRVRNEFHQDSTVLVDGEKQTEKIERKEPELVVVSTGIGFSIAYEAIDTLGFWERVRLVKIGFDYPLPVYFLHEHIADSDKVLIVEDTSAFIETEIRNLFAGENKQWFGRNNGVIDDVDELTPEKIIKIIKSVLDAQSIENIEEIIPENYLNDTEINDNLKPLPVRELSFCSGCPHRASFWIMKTVLEEINRKYVISGDIGCYTLGALNAGFNLLQTVNCMGSSIGMSAGFNEITRLSDSLSIAVIGDSTLVHSGLPGLLDSKLSDSDILIVILDNDYVAMTGGQESAGSTSNIEKLLTAFEIPFEITNPFDFKESVLAFYESVEHNGTRCLIFKAPCAFQSEKHGELENKEFYIDAEMCEYGKEDCSSLCTKVFSCPAIHYDAQLSKPQINTEMCKRCGFCISVCKKDAIKIKNQDGEDLNEKTDF